MNEFGLVLEISFWWWDMNSVIKTILLCRPETVKTADGYFSRKCIFPRALHLGSQVLPELNPVNVSGSQTPITATKSRLGPAYEMEIHN